MGVERSSGPWGWREALGNGGGEKLWATGREALFPEMCDATILGSKETREAMLLMCLNACGGPSGGHPYFRGGEGVGFRDYPQAGVA